MKNKITITSSVAGLSALLIVYLRLHAAALSADPRVTWYLFVSGLALAFLGAVLAARSLTQQWRNRGVVGQFIWSLAVLAGFAGLLAYGP